MALKDVKQYYLKMLSQYVEAKNDLADFEQGVKDGYITEDRLAEVKEEIDRLEENVNRLSYVSFLYELPRRAEKRKKFMQQNVNLLELFSQCNADEDSVISENTSLLKLIKQQLTELTNK